MRAAIFVYTHGIFVYTHGEALNLRGLLSLHKKSGMLLHFQYENTACTGVGVC